MLTLAGENHAGKSLLMYHIGICLAESKPTNIVANDVSPKQRYFVLMYDRENPDTTLKIRYGSYRNDNFRIIRGTDFQTIDDLLDDIELQVVAIESSNNIFRFLYPFR